MKERQKYYHFALVLELNVYSVRFLTKYFTIYTRQSLNEEAKLFVNLMSD